MMNMLGDKKKVAGLIIASRMGPDEPDDEKKSSESSKKKVSAELMVAAEEVLEAFRAGKASELAEALCAFHHLVDAEQYEEEAEEEREKAAE